MAGKKAKIVDDGGLRLLLARCATHRYPTRDRVLVLLSFKAGLRAMEIALIRRANVLTPAGEVTDRIDLEDSLCKKGHGKTIPMHPLLKSALIDHFADFKGPQTWPLILSERAMRGAGEDPEPMSPKSIGYFFWRLYRKCGLVGCSSHSGRRTFITFGARRATKVGASLRDVQLLAGHANLTTTQGYIDGDTDAQRNLVELL